MKKLLFNYWLLSKDKPITHRHKKNYRETEDFELSWVLFLNEMYK